MIFLSRFILELLVTFPTCPPPRDAEAAVGAFIDSVRDLEPTDFSKVFD